MGRKYSSSAGSSTGRSTPSKSRERVEISRLRFIYVPFGRCAAGTFRLGRLRTPASYRPSQYSDVVGKRYLRCVYRPLAGAKREGLHACLNLLTAFIREHSLSPSLSPVCIGHAISRSKWHPYIRSLLARPELFPVAPLAGRPINVVFCTRKAGSDRALCPVNCRRRVPRRPTSLKA
jgi:hypothetical protein